MSLYEIEVPSFSLKNAFGGKPYSLQVSIGFSSPTSFEVSFVSEDGEYKISKNDLNSETPSELSIGSLTFSVYPTSYKITRSPSGNILSVRYSDASIKYLDKFNICFSSVKKDRVISIIPCFVTDQDTDIENRTYSPSELLDGMTTAGIPVSANVISLLSPFTNKAPTLPSQPIDSYENIIIDDNYAIFNQAGKLRDVLSYIGGFMSVLFFWNWGNGGEGQLDVIDLKDGVIDQNSEALYEEIKASYSKVIGEIQESASIEDCQSVSDLAYTADSDAYAISRTVKLVELDIPQGYFLIEGSGSNQYYNRQIWSNGSLFPSTSGSIPYGKIDSSMVGNNDNWKALCYAALVGEDFFYSYILHNLAIEMAASYWYPVTSSNSTSSTEPNPSESERGLTETYYQNSIVPNMFGGSQAGLWTVGGLIAFVPKEADGGLVKVQTDYGAQRRGRLDIIKKIDTEVRKQAASIGDGYWVFQINDYIDLKYNMKNVYRKCLAWGQLYNRYYISKSRWTYGNAQRHEVQPMGDSISSVEWLYEATPVDRTHFSRVRELIYPSDDTTSTSYSQYDGNSTAWAEFMGKSGDFFALNGNAVEPTGLAPKDHGYWVLDAAASRESPQRPARRAVCITSESTFGAVRSNQQKSIGNLLLVSRVRDLHLYVGQMANRVFKQLPSTKTAFLYKEELVVPRLDIMESFADLRNKYAVSNSVDIHKIEPWGTKAFELTDPDRTERKNIVRSPESYKKFVASRKVLNPTPSISYTMQINSFVQPDSSWLKRGMEQFGVSIGSNGVSTSITVSSRKKQRQSLEDFQRLAIDDLEEIRVVKRPRSSSDKMPLGIRVKIDT